MNLNTALEKDNATGPEVLNTLEKAAMILNAFREKYPNTFTEKMGLKPRPLLDGFKKLGTKTQYCATMGI